MTITMTRTSKKTLPVWSTGSSFKASKKKKAMENRGGGSSADEPQDADYDIPSLSDELETLILARLPRSEHWKLCFLNKRLQALVKSGEIIKIRREIGFKEPSVFMLASGETNWWVFDEHFESCRMLPFTPSDYNFTHGDKESFFAGSHLFVSGREFDGAAVWKYEVETNQWLKAPSMINPRCLFASATSGNYAFVAGGQDTTTYSQVLDSAEKYNSKSKSWESLPRMNRKRKSCSGCYMDKKFYVIGGQDEQQNVLTCGEFFDEETNTWNSIPDMLKDIPVSVCRSPPLVAVANNQLYALDASSNELKTYLKRTNSWKKLGTVPVMASAQGGWGVAFKSLGNELLVIGATAMCSSGRGLTIYTCCPDPSAEELQWRRIESGNAKLSPFIHNCAVRVA
ncbi:F-box/kelch-repeat protein At3g27150-like isoform X2 [Neltuma alba]|nr:F-box/kelch-repeat protein At3g27150-like isoform X2 [Prosopis alba]XP_028772463.1 F-box/kelch-repeat protein At3g27150-like isoform X2 [Prosopis alba]XP_028772464.1 F-box/kelch-repeat protein At3g27150-like isoform X2 [Prosopis alba]XP_028772480.1 F-box/kelch-repeat protein At3g27150-like isoform X2 [Prosopis alba]